MSQQIANVSLAAAIVGTTGSVSWGKLLTPPTIEQQMRPGQSSAATLLIHNESGAQLLLTFPDTGRSISFPAGKWAALHVRANELSVTYKVTAIAPSPLFTSLLVDFYWPGEPIDPMGTLGNSPIGGPVTSVTQVIQDGQPSGQTLVESTPTGSSSSTVLVTTDGRYISRLQASQAFEWNGAAGANFWSIFDINPSDGGQKHWGLAYNGGDQHVQLQNITDNVDVVDFDPVGGMRCSNYLQVGGAVTQINGQNTAGSFGVRTIVAQATRVAVTVTGNQNILTFTPAANGFYSISGYVKWTNGSNSAVVASVTWTDPDAGATNNFLATTATGSTTPVLLSGSTTLLAGTTLLPLIPIVVDAATTGNIICKWNDPSGTPNDLVTYFIERLS